MPHINTGPGEHDTTASAYIVRLDAPEPALMLHRHKILDQYLQFGGHIERKENLWQTVAHELAEESGYTMPQLKVLQPQLRIASLSSVQLHPIPICLLTHPFEGIDHFHTDIAFAFTAEGPPGRSPVKGESEEITLFTAQELRQLPAADIPENVREIGLFLLEQCLDQWEAVNSQAWA